MFLIVKKRARLFFPTLRARAQRHLWRLKAVIVCVIRIASMPSPFTNSIFAKLILGKPAAQLTNFAIMGGISGSSFSDGQSITELPVVVFDFETTGLDTKTARIIEIGAVKYIGRKEVDRYSTLINPGMKLPPETFGITGINDAMLEGQPGISSVLTQFHDFLRGCVGVAHNAEFDTGMLTHESARLGIRCCYHVLCTLKMARALVKCERKNLDSLATHYNLTFESRHRSIGDILVTAQVLWHMLDENPHLQTLKDFAPYQEIMVDV